MSKDKDNLKDPLKEEHDAKWAFLESLKLYPTIESMSWYNRALGKGLIVARHELKTLDVNKPTPDLAATVHRIVYGSLFHWAGEFRQQGLGFVNAEFSRHPDVPGSPFQRIEEHLQIAGSKFAVAFQREGVETKAAAMAEYHHRFEQIHPLLIGNGVVGRLILDEQARRGLGAERPLELERDVKYLGSLRLADKGIQTTELRDLILASSATQLPSLERAERDMAEAETEARRWLSALAERGTDFKLSDFSFPNEGWEEALDAELRALQDERQETLIKRQRGQERDNDFSHEH